MKKRIFLYVLVFAFSLSIFCVKEALADQASEKVSGKNNNYRRTQAQEKFRRQQIQDRNLARRHALIRAEDAKRKRLAGPGNGSGPPGGAGSFVTNNTPDQW